MRRQWRLNKRLTKSRKWILIGLSLGLLFLIGVIVCDLSGFFDYHPSDKVLIENFRTHRQDFETLAAMAGEDEAVTNLFPSLVMFNDYKEWPKDDHEGFSWPRWNQYDALFKRLGTASTHELLKESGVIHFPASAITTEPDDGYEYRVSMKGYAFSRTPLSSLDDSLDEMGVDDLGTHYRRIDEHWYLYHDCGIGKPE